MSIEFLPQLQLPWHLANLRMFSADEVILDVAVSERLSYPESMGRQVHDVLSWPETWIENATAEFKFESVIFASLSEEWASFAETADVFEGTTFRRYSESHLLRQCRGARAGAEHSVLHYQLVFQNEQVDIVCTVPPRITLRQQGT